MRWHQIRFITNVRNKLAKADAVIIKVHYILRFNAIIIVVVAISAIIFNYQKWDECKKKYFFS